MYMFIYIYIYIYIYNSRYISIIDNVQHRSIKTKWDGKLDQQGFRILTNQVPCFDYKTEDEMFKVIRDSMIFENGKSGDVIAMCDNQYKLYIYIYIYIYILYIYIYIFIINIY